jgi:hypothetical protein
LVARVLLGELLIIRSRVSRVSRVTSVSAINRTVKFRARRQGDNTTGDKKAATTIP